MQLIVFFSHCGDINLSAWSQSSYFWITWPLLIQLASTPVQSVAHGITVSLSHSTWNQSCPSVLQMFLECGDTVLCCCWWTQCVFVIEEHPYYDAFTLHMSMQLSTSLGRITAMQALIRLINERDMRLSRSLLLLGISTRWYSLSHWYCVTWWEKEGRVCINYLHSWQRSLLGLCSRQISLTHRISGSGLQFRRGSDSGYSWMIRWEEWPEDEYLENQ